MPLLLPNLNIPADFSVRSIFTLTKAFSTEFVDPSLENCYLWLTSSAMLAPFLAPLAFFSKLLDPHPFLFPVFSHFSMVPLFVFLCPLEGSPLTLVFLFCVGRPYFSTNGQFTVLNPHLGLKFSPFSQSGYLAQYGSFIWQGSPHFSPFHAARSHFLFMDACPIPDPHHPCDSLVSQSPRVQGPSVFFFRAPFCSFSVDWWVVLRNLVFFC